MSERILIAEKRRRGDAVLSAAPRRRFLAGRLVVQRGAASSVAEKRRQVGVLYSCALSLNLVVISLFCAFSLFAAEDAGRILYQNTFEQAALDKVPDEFLVLDGGFAVKEISGNKVLQLPGAPLETFGVLFGPSESANTRITVRIYGTGKGRRFPAFGVGLNGNAGFKLQVSPAKKLVELYKGDEIMATAPFAWESDSWTQFKLQVRKVGDGEFVVEGKAWKQGTAEPDKWLITHTVKTEAGKELNAGRASIWGNPFAGTPIDYDDLLVTRI